MGILTKLFGRWFAAESQPERAVAERPKPAPPRPRSPEHVFEASKSKSSKGGGAGGGQKGAPAALRRAPNAPETPTPSAAAVLPERAAPARVDGPGGWDAASVEALLGTFDDVGSGAAPEEDVGAADALSVFTPDAVDDLLGGLDGPADGANGVAPGAFDASPELFADEEVPEAREMFEGIAAVYLGPVRQFLSLLQRGAVSKDWLDLCSPAVAMVARSARSMGLASLADPLKAFEAALEAAAREDSGALEGATREGLLSSAAELAMALPQAFGASCADGERDGVIFPSFLRQIPEVGKVTLDRLFGAGLTSIEVLGRASPDELQVTTGIPRRLAERICSAVARYRVESQARLASSSPSDWLDLVRSAVSALDEHHAGYQALDGPEGERGDDASGRKRLRRLRQEAALKTEILLAEMGEVQFVDELQRLSFEARLRRLRAFLTSRDAATAPAAVGEAG